jgi:hypothetical protein
MRKIKGLLVAFAMIMIISTFFTNYAFSAQAYQMDKGKGHVFIDAGENEGFILGANVCFISCKSEELVCGNVQTTSHSSAMVKVDHRATTMRKICPGSEALLYVGEEKKEEVKEGEEKEEKKKEPERINIKGWFK